MAKTRCPRSAYFPYAEQGDRRRKHARSTNCARGTGAQHGSCADRNAAPDSVHRGGGHGVADALAARLARGQMPNRAGAHRPVMVAPGPGRHGHQRWPTGRWRARDVPVEGGGP